MTKTLLLLFFVTFLNEVTRAQQFQKANTASIMSILTGDKSKDNNALEETASVKLTPDNASQNDKAPKVVGAGMEGRKYHNRYAVAADDLPEVVLQTLEDRYYARGFKGQNFQKIELADGTHYYSADLSSESMALYIILNEYGRVFKAELK